MDERILARIAELFYIYNISQYEIAEKFNFSKAKVCRILKEAKSKGIIEFTIKRNDKNYIDLEKKVEDKYDLKEVITYNAFGFENNEKDLVLRGVGSLGASYIERILKNDLKIAVAGGKTLFHTFKEIKSNKKSKIDIYSTLGGISLSKAEYQNNDLIKMLCEKIGGTCHPIYLPIMLEKIIKNKIIIAFGKEKILALKGILNSRIPDILITDTFTASEIIK